MSFHVNDPDIDLNQPRSTRFPRLSRNLDVVTCSRNHHAPYSTDSQSADTTDQILPRELPESNGDNIWVVDQQKYHCHEMRIPVVDPRRSRRHGTDFGLGRYAKRSLTVLNSDHHNPTKAISVSVPPTVEDNPPTDGDSVSSLFKYGLEFPEPPPIDSPAIRRMRSSPWFSYEDQCMHEEFPRQGNRRPRRSASVLLDSNFRDPCYSISSSMRREILRTERRNFSEMVEETTDAEGARLHSSPYLDLRINDVSLEMVGEALVGLDMNASNMGLRELSLDDPAYSAAPSCGFSQASDSGGQLARSYLDWPIPSDLLRWSTSHRSAPLLLAPTSQQGVLDEDTLHNTSYEGHSFRTKPSPTSSLSSEHQGMRSLAKLPRVIRKVASMKSDSRRLDDTNCVPLGLTGPRTVSRSRSFRSIPLVACEMGNTLPHQHSDRSFGDLDNFSSSKHVRDLKSPFGPLNDSLRTFEYCKDRGTQHMSLPSSGIGSLKSEAGQHKAKVSTLTMALSLPFVHRETCNRPSTRSEKNLPSETDKSFINITPNQGTKDELLAEATKRARVKKLIARASNSIIGWGRHLTKKTSSVK